MARVCEIFCRVGLNAYTDCNRVPFLGILRFNVTVASGFVARETVELSNLTLANQVFGTPEIFSYSRPCSDLVVFPG